MSDKGWRYVSVEEEQFLAAKKSAYESVLRQAADFMRKEAFLWKQNNDLYKRALKAEEEVKQLKTYIELMEGM